MLEKGILMRNLIENGPFKLKKTPDPLGPAVASPREIDQTWPFLKDSAHLSVCVKCLCVMVKASRSVANKGVEAMVQLVSKQGLASVCMEICIMTVCSRLAMNLRYAATIEGEVSNALECTWCGVVGVDTNKYIGLGSESAVRSLSWWLMISRIYKVYGVDSIVDVLFMVLIQPYKFKIDDVSTWFIAGPIVVDLAIAMMLYCNCYRAFVVMYCLVEFHRFDETKEQKNETRRTNLALWDSRRLEVKQ
ncbi:hypothetical protein Tco_0280296 [Tanacetum coccineum]